MNKFEYSWKQLDHCFSVDQFMIELNKLGQEGWEVVHMLNPTSTTPILYLKRKLKKDQQK